jgi:protoporphyrin/coproporphyrin ferrochelatase
MKIAIILFNLGGPDSLEAVQPFLRNLFSDPAIISLPSFLRKPLARFIAARRGPTARAIYAQIGGGSPILGQSESQARALEDALGTEHDCRAFVCMRYWHPMTEAAAKSVKRFAPDRILLLPLYPQMSTTTTQSSVRAWHEAAAKVNLEAPTQTVCCYPVEQGFIHASADLLRESIATIGARPLRVLFSAHGLPEKIIKAGDPYAWQIERTAAAIAARLAIPELDWVVCYQSRVGPLKWIGPSTIEEIERAGRDGKAVALYPLAFVSEHSETLVELDIEYRHLAEKSGVPVYARAPAVGTHPAFIAGLAALVRRVLAAPEIDVQNDGAVARCAAGYTRCLRTEVGT